MTYFIGNNKFDGRFDFYKWSAPFFDTPKDIAQYIDSLNLKGKVLTRINTIGSVSCHTYYSFLHSKLTEAGIDPGDDWYHTYDLDKIMIPWSVWLCEPVQFIFDDGTSLEILPLKDGGARIGINSIPQNISDGLNHSNFDANIFFHEILGLQIESFSMYTVKKCDVKNSSSEQENKYICQFSFGHQYEMILEYDNTNAYNTYYDIKIGYDENISYARARASQKDVKQIEITCGHCGGGVFNIQPVNMDKPEDEFWQLDKYGITIDEENVEEFLDVFLSRYYDPNIQEGYRKYANMKFEWYDENLFTFDSIRKIIKDIRKECELLLNDYDNSALKKAASYSTWIPYETYYLSDWEQVRKDYEAKYRISVALDFYERFCTQMENMMMLPDKNAILFYGP